MNKIFDFEKICDLKNIKLLTLSYSVKKLINQENAI